MRERKVRAHVKEYIAKKDGKCISCRYTMKRPREKLSSRIFKVEYEDQQNQRHIARVELKMEPVVSVVKDKILTTNDNSVKE